VIDRPEDGDGAAVLPARNRADAAPATPDQRAAVHRQYQDMVEHTYDVARVDSGEDERAEPHKSPPRDEAESDETAERAAEAEETSADDAWAEAVTELRAEWEKHEQRFPERTRVTPGTQLDGSWVADGNRKLTPEQNTDASKACEDIRTEGREVIRPAMERVEAADPDRHLAGLQHMLKGEDRLKEKMADYLSAPGTTVSEALDAVPDAVRFTFTYDSERYAEGVLSDVDRLKSEGFELIKLKNLWTEEQYKGINSQWRRPETGLRFEMQFHTPESLEAKELTHRAYERIRGPASPAERSELEDFQRRVDERLGTPPGTAEIRDFPEKR
jgi:hypothetical protein